MDYSRSVGIEWSLCIYHFDCERWKTHCGDCPYLDKPFALSYDHTALDFEVKKQAIQNSQISAIVASNWMKKKIEQSPIWKGKKIYKIPFGINHDLFKPADDIKLAKKKLGINPENFVIFFRSDLSPYKGLDVIKETLSYLDQKSISLITVGQIGNLADFRDKYDIHEYGLVNDDELMVSFYQACDLFLMPSKQEAFGMMAIEAVSCGKLVVVLDADTALPDTVNAPQCSIAVKEIDYPKEIQRLIMTPQEIIDRGKTSLEYARKEYNKDVYIDRIINVYKEVIATHKNDEASQYILKQLEKNSEKFNRKKKIKFPLWYRYFFRILLIILLSKQTVKEKYDLKYGKFKKSNEVEH